MIFQNMKKEWINKMILHHMEIQLEKRVEIIIDFNIKEERKKHIARSVQF